MSFSQTSIFGRFGRALMQPIHRKLKAPVYQGELARPAIKVFQWGAGVLRTVCPRRVSPRLNTPHIIIYTDAATSTRIAPIIVFDKPEFRAHQVIRACRGMYADAKWIELPDEARLIYGLQMLSVVQTAADPSRPIQGKCITFYVDRKSSLGSLVKADSKIAAITVLARIFRAICAHRGITPWFGRVPSDFNISDIPTRFKSPSFGRTRLRTSNIRTNFSRW